MLILIFICYSYSCVFLLAVLHAGIFILFNVSHRAQSTEFVVFFFTLKFFYIFYLLTANRISYGMFIQDLHVLKPTVLGIQEKTSMSFTLGKLTI